MLQVFIHLNASPFENNQNVGPHFYAFKFSFHRRFICLFGKISNNPLVDDNGASRFYVDKIETDSYYQTANTKHNPFPSVSASNVIRRDKIQ